MARSELALSRARSAYERAHVRSAVRGLAIAAALAVIAFALHRTSSATWPLVAVLGATLAALGWRGGAARRGALAGVIAGLPPLVAPALVFAASHGTLGPACETCASNPTWLCMIVCFGTSSLVGAFVGQFAVHDPRPRTFGAAAIASAALTGLLGCGTTGLGGAAGVVVGLIAGGITGWVTAGRTVRA